jgi:hypothetical protein
VQRGAYRPDLYTEAPPKHPDSAVNAFFDHHVDRAKGDGVVVVGVMDITALRRRVRNLVTERFSDALPAIDREYNVHEHGA